MFPEIRPGGVFIADAHYTDERTGLTGLLASLQASPPPQVFLMGDIFDLHIGPFAYLHRHNQPLIKQIEALAAICEVWFFEGNHDFLLEGRLCGVHYVPLSAQPMIFRFGDEQVALAHGDYDEGLLHGLFTRLIRSVVGIRLIHLMTLNFLGNWFLKKEIRRLKGKKLCRNFEDFALHIGKKIKKNPPNADIIIEGHYHQGVTFEVSGKRYVNVPGFACNQSYSVIESGQNTVQFRVETY